MFWIIMLGFVALLTVAMLIFLSPGDKPKEVKRKVKEVKPKPQAAPVAAVSPAVPEKDWKAIAERWEKNNAALNANLEKQQAKERGHVKEVEALEAKIKDLSDKLTLEKSWREKEQVTLDKFKHHEKDFKEQIMRTESDLEKEHSNRLRVEREFQEIKIKYDAVLEEKRQLAVKASSLETTVAQISKEIKELKSDNAKLKEKREDVQWVAKTAYDELNAQYKEVQRQLDAAKGA